MNKQALKNPSNLTKLIIGAILVASLVALFLPSFFERVSQTIYLDKIPPAPKATTYNLLSAADFTTLKTTPVNTVLTPATAWLIQVDRFADPLKADRLVEQLRQQGYPAYALKKADDYVVLIGPETDKTKLVPWLSDLKKQHSGGQIISYNPQT